MGIDLVTRWTRKPGNFDKLNMLRTFPGTGKYGIPELAPCRMEQLPAGFMAFDDYRTIKTKPADTGIHFYTDDYRFEQVWNNPDGYSELAKSAHCILTPDFSTYRDWPLAAQLWNVYRSRWVGAVWQSMGIEVIPTVTWSDERSYDFCFDGLPRQAPLSVSTKGVKEPEALRLFAKGYYQMVRRLDPNIVLIMGERTVGFDSEMCPVHWYGDDWIKALRKRANKPKQQPQQTEGE